MKSIVLAAGYATRLYPLTKDRPKPLLDIGGKPVLEHILAHLETLDAIETIFIVVNHKFLTLFENWKTRYPSSKSILLLDDGSTHEDNRLGAIGDLRFCVQSQRIDEDLLVIAGDNLFDMDLGAFLQFAKKKSPFCSLMLYDVKDLSLARHYGIVGIDTENRIVSFEEKPRNPQSTLSAMGVYYFPRKVLRTIETYLKSGSPQDAPGFLIRWLFAREPVYGYPSEGLWYDIGDLESYQKASELFQKKSMNRENSMRKEER